MGKNPELIVRIGVVLLIFGLILVFSVFTLQTIRLNLSIMYSKPLSPEAIISTMLVAFAIIMLTLFMLLLVAMIELLEGAC